MKAKILLDGDKPKVSPVELKGVIEAADIEVVHRRADFGVVVGGDGLFSRFGRTEGTPLLFVGVRSRSPTGSKAILAEAFLDELPAALGRIKAGDYRVQGHKRLQVLRNGRSIGEVFTDVYLQRGADSNCLRYKVKIRGREVSIDESAIGDGIVVSTAAGATGYYSYPDRIKHDQVDPIGYSNIAYDQVGICHINPTFTERAGDESHPLRYRVPWGCTVELSLRRRADARLYGATGGRGGVKVGRRDTIEIAPADSVTKVITLTPEPR